jgi:hypothetical protein
MLEVTRYNSQSHAFFEIFTSLHYIGIERMKTVTIESVDFKMPRLICLFYLLKGKGDTKFEVA